MAVKFLKTNSRGDTIIEVLIAIAVATSILAISFSTMNRNLQTMRATQEQTEAIKAVQAQVETVRSAYNNDLSGLPKTGTSGFCVRNNVVYSTGASPTASLAADNWANYPAGCTTGTAGRYRLSVVPKVDASGKLTYVVRTRWDRVGGQSREEIIMSYRVN